MTITISQRVLNRTFLQRQFLLERTEMSALEVTSRLLALQSQATNSPYESLWNRIEGFKPAELDSAFLERKVVRGTWFRSTVHTTTAEDYLAFRGLHSKLFRDAAEGLIPGLEDPSWVEELKKLYSGVGALTGPELVALASTVLPGQDPVLLRSNAVRRAVTMLREPKGSAGRTHGPRDPWIEAEGYLGAKLEEPTTGKLEELIRRYLTGYGPASPEDASSFLGITHLRETFETMKLREYESESGAKLYDNATGTLADEELEAPPRLMASFDHSILGHSDRTRIIEKSQSRILSGVNAVFKPYILIEGKVAGYWSYSLTKNVPTVKLNYFSRPTAKQESALLIEAGSWCETWYGTQQGLRIVIEDH